MTSSDSSDAHSAPACWIEEAATLHADCAVFTVARRRFRHPERERAHDFFVVEPADWAVAMARTPDQRWLLVRQFRVGLRDLTWEFPSGCINPGEEPAAAARRELEEETGFRAPEAAIPLGTIHPNPAIMDNRCSFFLFENVTAVGTQAWDPHEEISLTTLSDDELDTWATDGRITHALMHAGLYLYQRWKRTAGGAP